MFLLGALQRGTKRLIHHAMTPRGLLRIPIARYGGRKGMTAFVLQTLHCGRRPRF